MITRKQYMAGEATHREYYGQFVTPYIVESVARYFGSNRLLASTDEHLNDIPLHMWDRAPWFGMDRDVAEANGSGGVSLNDKVCCLKEAARQFIEGEQA